MRTRPNLSWSDLRGARVGVWGLGVEGHANLRQLLAIGASPVLVDDDPAPGSEAIKTDEGGLDALRTCEVVVKTPGISRYRPDVQQLEAAGIAVAGGLGLWMQEADRDRVACITGTKGKSTTTSIAGHLLQRLGFRCFVGGNIGDAALGSAGACGRRLLGHRDLQLPGHRSGRRAPRRRGDVAAS